MNHKYNRKLNDSVKEAIRRVVLKENMVAGGHPGYTVPTAPQTQENPFTPTSPAQNTPAPRLIPPTGYPNPSGGNNSPYPRPIGQDGRPYRGYPNQGNNGVWYWNNPNGYPLFWWDESINPYTNQPNGWTPVMS